MCLKYSRTYPDVYYSHGSGEAGVGSERCLSDTFRSPTASWLAGRVFFVSIYMCLQCYNL